MTSYTNVKAKVSFIHLYHLLLRDQLFINFSGGQRLHITAPTAQLYLLEQSVI